MITSTFTFLAPPPPPGGLFPFVLPNVGLDGVSKLKL